MKLFHSFLLNQKCIYFRTAIALRGSDGVVFAVEKLVTSKLHEDGTGKRLFSVENHIGMVYLRKRTLYRNYIDDIMKILFST